MANIDLYSMMLRVEREKFEIKNQKTNIDLYINYSRLFAIDLLDELKVSVAKTDNNIKFKIIIFSRICLWNLTGIPATHKL